MLASPTFNVVMASVPQEKVGMANGTVRSFNTLAQAMGATVGVVMWFPLLSSLLISLFLNGEEHLRKMAV